MLDGKKRLWRVGVRMTLAAAALVLGLTATATMIGCDLFDDDDENTGTGGGGAPASFSVNLYGSSFEDARTSPLFDALTFDEDEAARREPGERLVQGCPNPSLIGDCPSVADRELLSLVATVLDVQLYETPDSEPDILTPSGPLATLDLVALQDSPDLFGSFDVDPGQYRCVSATIRVESYEVVVRAGEFRGCPPECPAFRCRPATKNLCNRRSCTTLSNFPDNIIQLPVVCSDFTQLNVDGSRAFNRVLELDGTGTCDETTGEGTITINPIDIQVIPLGSFG
ncbi:MAG: hypothetical protein JSV80_01455 [Acidobacteriota bacterium]|nr:MAG: hypothetical protein JSV80_01455 [Acidobacteriota bacterium]